MRQNEVMTEFLVKSEELRQALKFVLPSSVRGHKTQTEFIVRIPGDRDQRFPAMVIEIPG